jgi:hypothetical protein
MAKFERPQKQNPLQLAINQHTFPAKSIARFTNLDGRVDLRMKALKTTRRAKPTDKIFCARRAWDHGSEVKFIKKVEDEFQELAELILTGQVKTLDRQKTHIVNLFYVLWMIREQIREQPGKDAVLAGVLPGDLWSRDEEEKLEKAGLAFTRGNVLPARVLNGINIRIQVGHYLREFPIAHRGIVHAANAEFIVPEWPKLAFVPITPTLALLNSAVNQKLHSRAVGIVNEQLRQASRRYFFARDFATCP